MALFSDHPGATQVFSLLAGAALTAVGAVVALPEQAGASATGPSCAEYTTPAPATFPNWAEDTHYELIRGKRGEAATLRIVGDVLDVNASTMPSLVRDIDQAASRLAEVVLDAREVHLRAPLSFQSTQLRILADTVVIHAGAAIALVGAPGGQGDGVTLRAREIVFARALPRPFAFRTTADARHFTLRAARVVDEDASVLSGERAVRALWQRSLANAGYAYAVPPGWDVEVSEEAYRVALPDLHAEANWPRYFSFKVAQHFARDPFGEANRAALLAQIDAVSPTLADLGAAEALAAVAATRALIDQRIDALGHSSAFVPRQDLINSLQHFRADVESGFKRLTALQTLALAVYDGHPVDATLLKSVREDADAAASVASAQTEKVTEILTDLATNEAAIAEFDRLIEARRERLRRKLEEMKQKAEDMANLKGATTVLSLGAALIPTAGPFIAAGISATGELIYQHNTGQPLTVESFASIASKSAAFYAATKDAQANWQKHVADLDTARKVWAGHPPAPEKPDQKPLDKAGAAKASAVSAAQFAKSVKGMVDLLNQMPAPTSVSMSQLESEDGELNQLLSRIAELRSKQATLVDELVQAQTAITAATAREASADQAALAILAADPRNDAEFMRWKLAAHALWRAEIETLYRESLLLRKSVYFETERLLILPAEVYQFPEESLGRLASGALDLDNDASWSRERTEAFFVTETARHRAALEAMAAAAQRAFDEYADSRAGGATPFVQTFVFDRKEGGDAARLIDALNAQIRQQLRNVEAGRPIRSPRLELPIKLPSPPVDSPERLLNISLSNVKFDPASALTGKSINFDLSYELAGDIRRNGRCRFIDMRRPGADSAVIQRIEASEAVKSADTKVVPLTFQELARYPAAPAARTPYYLSVQIEGNPADPKWKRVPEISSLVITMRIVQ